MIMGTEKENIGVYNIHYIFKACYVNGSAQLCSNGITIFSDK